MLWILAESEGASVGRVHIDEQALPLPPSTSEKTETWIGGPRSDGGVSVLKIEIGLEVGFEKMGATLSWMGDCTGSSKKRDRDALLSPRLCEARLFRACPEKDHCQKRHGGEGMR